MIFLLLKLIDENGVESKIYKEDFNAVIKSQLECFTNSLNSKNSSISESINTYSQTDFIYDTNFFSQALQNFTCLAFLGVVFVYT